MYIKGIGRVKFKENSSLIEIREGITYRCCYKCKKFKVTSEFHFNQKSSTGTYSYCKECMKEYGKKRYLKDPSKSKESVLKRQFNITLEQYQIMYQNQEGKCLICKDYYEVLSVDHDHITSIVRGLLCNHCNRGLGGFKDKIELLKIAIQYLTQSNNEDPYLK